MKSFVTFGVALLASALLVACSSAPSGPPHVVSTSPALNATVPSSTTAISVTYDRPMRASWSFVQMMTATFPFRTGEPTISADHLTITMPVRLQPNTEYTLGLNSLNFHNFADTSGLPATPYVLTFRTGS